MTDDEIMNTPSFRVGATAHTLSACVSDLYRMRLDPETADEVLREEGSLLAALGTLRVLVEDIRKAYDKRNFVEAAE